MTRAPRLAWVSVATLIGLQAGCGSSLPGEIPGGRIQGLITYRGDRLADIPRPMVGVYAFATMPTGADDSIIPNAFQLYPPEFGERGIRYELENLEPYAYLVTAQLVDLDQPPGHPLAAGYYPNLLQPERVEVTLETASEDIDIELYDMWE